MSMKLRFSVTCILYRKNLPDVTQVLNVYVIHIKFLQNGSFLRKLNPLISHLLNLSFSRPLQLIKINVTESYDFFLALTYRARIQLIFTNTRGMQYFSVRKHLFLALQGSKFDPRDEIQVH